MSRVVVRSQAELDAALARTDLTYADDEIVIDTPRGEWLVVGDTRGLNVRASGSSAVNAYGSATVRASGSATVRAYGSATVHASGLGTVAAYGSATVHAYGSVTVTASGSATVHAYGSATVTAYDSATVYAHDSATVHAYDSATAHAGSHVAIHRHTTRATVHGGTIIDHTNLDLNNPQTWADYTGAHIQDGEVVLYKAVDDTLTAGHSWTPTTYPIGQTVTCEDWRDDNDCGGGLHASPHPHQALAYYSDAERMLRVAAPLDSIRPIGTDKAKAPLFRVLDEVSLTGRPLTEAVAR